MTKTLLTLFMCLNVAGIFYSCGCPAERYFDYSAINLIAQNPFVAPDDTLNMSCDYENMFYLAHNTVKRNPFATAAYATTVCEKGYDGDKYKKTSILVTSDSDFDAEHPAGTDLADLIKVYGIDSVEQWGQKFLNELQPQYVQLNSIIIESRPETDNSHVFTIEIKKSNGAVLTAVSPEIIWE